MSHFVRALVLACLITLGASAVAQAATTVLYVSPRGNDRNPGTSGRPFRTLERAQNAARQVRRPLRGDIIVLVGGGTYRLSRPLTLRQADSGGNGYDVFYEPAPGTHPVISGGRRITGWTLFNRARGIYRARAVGLRTRQLYVNGRRLPRAQSALNPSGFTKTATGYTTTNLAMAKWGNQSDMEVFSNWRWKSFRCPVASIVGNRITMSQPCWHNANVFFGPASMGLPTRIENAYELLSQPRQWYLDQLHGWIYYTPARGEDWRARTLRPPAHRCSSTRAGRWSIRSATPGRRPDVRVCDMDGVSRPQGYADDQTGFHVSGAKQPQTFEHAQFTTRTPGTCASPTPMTWRSAGHVPAHGRSRGSVRHRQPTRHDRWQSLQRYLCRGDPGRGRRKY